MPWLYLGAIVLAEILVAAVEPWLGLALHVLLALALVTHGATTADERGRALLWALILAPLIRIVSLTLPLQGLSQATWYPLIAAPVLLAALIAARALGYSRHDLGLTLQARTLPLQLSVAALGPLLGLIQFALLRPRPLVSGSIPVAVWLPTLVLALAVGFVEELVFRGLIQRAAVGRLGAGVGIVYSTALATGLSGAHEALPASALVFATGLLFAVVTWRTGSILGVALAHGGFNIMFWLLAPLLPMPPG